jgi:heme-degrading monooxygenase HmoA
MFARNVLLQLKPNTLSKFAERFEHDVLPVLQKHPGFRDVFICASEDGAQVISISLWDSKEEIDTYNATAYPQVLKSLEELLDGPPSVRSWKVMHATFHRSAVGIAA